MTVWEIFKNHNDLLTLRLIDDLPPEGWVIDPNDFEFDMPLSEINLP